MPYLFYPCQSATSSASTSNCSPPCWLHLLSAALTGPPQVSFNSSAQHHQMFNATNSRSGIDHGALQTRRPPIQPNSVGDAVVAPPYRAALQVPPKLPPRPGQAEQGLLPAARDREVLGGRPHWGHMPDPRWVPSPARPFQQSAKEEASDRRKAIRKPCSLLVSFKSACPHDRSTDAFLSSA